jgi:hypothetical protein
MEKTYQWAAALGVNAKNPIKPAKQDTKKTIKKEVGRFITQVLAPHFRASGEFPTGLTSLLQRIDSLAEGCINEDKAKEYKFFTESDIKKVKHTLEGMVISPLDKNPGMLSIMCETRWHHIYEQLFSDESFFKPIDRTEQDMLRIHQQKFEETQLHEISHWNPRGQLPLSYFLTKNKDVLRQRPIVAACNHPSKSSLQICAKGGSLLI